MKLTILLCILFTLHICICTEEQEDDPQTVTLTRRDTSGYNMARVESCSGCSLNRLAGVKTFIYEDLPKYEKTEFKKIHGAPPELVFLDKDDEEMERIGLSDKTREECHILLLERGFFLKPGISSIKMNEEL